MRRPPSGVSSMRLSGNRVMSINLDGLAMPSLIRSIRFVPPATNFASGSAAICRIASATSLARLNSKLFMAPCLLAVSPTGVK